LSISTDAPSRRRRPFTRLLASLALVAAAASAPAQTVLPAGFEETVLFNLGSPTALAFTPDGRLLVSRQGGQLHVYAGGALLTPPALTVPNVCSNSERGLLGIAVDPQFAANHFVYLYYTVNKGTCYNRVSRFVLPATNVIDVASEVVLLDDIRSTAGNHNAGDLNFGKDGYLYVSVGDGGCDFIAPVGCAGANQAARRVNTLLGKMLRITRDGAVPPDNPWQGAGTASCRTGDAPPGTRCQETFAWGLRNPFRFAMDPGALGTRFFINDVGQGAWEEIDLGQMGADYGWNCREGAHGNPSAGSLCSPLPTGMVDPIHEYSHGTGCGSITGGAFVPTGFWPVGYDGSYLYADYNCGRMFQLSPSGGSYTSSTFVTGGGSPVHLEFGPYLSGVGLYYTTYTGGGQVRVIRFTGSANRAPTAVLAAAPLSGQPPLVVTFDATGSTDLDGDPLTYVWDFGDGTPATETATVVTTHTYVLPGTFQAVLRARDPSGALSDAVAVTVSVANEAPVPVILSPTVGELFRVGQTVTLQGSATDAEEGPLPDSRLTWNVLLHHDAHTHPFLTDVVGNDVVFTAPAPEDVAAAATSYLEVRLTATDAFGAQTTVSRDFNPRRVVVDFSTTPSGLNLRVNSTPFAAPFSFTAWDGWTLALEAPDQGAQAHAFVAPATDASLGASFLPAAPVPTASPFLGVTSTHQANRVEWVNPVDPAFGSAVLVFRTDRSPTTPGDGTVLFTGGVAGQKSVSDHTGLQNGTTYHYAVFVNLSGGAVSAGRFARGRPFDTAGPV
jgi:glucose/arabinose dehydrogenase